MDLAIWEYDGVVAREIGAAVILTVIVLMSTQQAPTRRREAIVVVEWRSAARESW